jgi:hypothetical protein
MARIGGSPRQAALSYRPAPAEDRDIVVELDDYRRKPSEDTFELKHGEAVEVEDEDVELADQGEFGRNLALDLDDDYLDDLGQELIEYIEGDIEERAPWRDRFERGLEQMGLVESDLDDGPFPGASNAVHPLLIEARTQFWARCMGELWPPDGPAKCKVEGQQSEPMLDRAQRVADYMNFEITVLDEGHIEEKSSMVWDLPLYGSCFVKTYRDMILNQNVGIYVPADDMIVPAEAKSLRTTPRFAHRMWKFPNEIRQLQQAGHYRQVELDDPRQEEQDEVQRLKDESQDVEPDGDDNTNRYELFETYINLDLEGDEHVDEEGNKTGLERTYICTVERQTGKVLSIYRGWREADTQCRRRLYFRHYRFCPGQGFYGSGLFHLIGGLQVAATGTLRVLLDSAASASLSGGFVGRNANLKGKRLVMTPGTWETVDATSEDLAKAFFSPPVKEPSPALFNLLGFLTEQGKSYTSTTELMTGDQDPKGAPVGTTTAMIEQGGKVMSTIHRMMYQELGAELRDRYELNREHAPPDGYPYEVAGQQKTVYADDFAPGMSIVPVADPNIFSSAQRMALNQMVYQVAMESGGIVPLKKAIRRLFQGARVPDVDELVPDDPEPITYDPVGEIQAVLMGKPVKVAPEQMHVMHLKVLWAFMSNPQYGGNPQVQQQVGPPLLSIMGQHMAYAWATHARGAGAPVGYMDPQSGQVVGGQGTPEQIATMLAQIAPALATVPGLPAIDAEGEGKEGESDKLEIAKAEIALKREEHQQDMEMQKEKHQLEMAVQQSKLQAQQQMDQVKAKLAVQKGQNDLQVAQAKAQQSMQQTQMEGEIAQQQAHQKMHMDQQNMERQASMDQQSMAQEQQMGQQEMAHKQQMGEQEAQLSQQKAQQQATQQSQGPDRLAHLRAPKPPEGGM